VKELEKLNKAVEAWCRVLEKNRAANFAAIARAAFDNLREGFATGTRDGKRNGLDGFAQIFKGGMGSANDLPFDDSAARGAVEKELERIRRAHW
jgi:hypothetical protein